MTQEEQDALEVKALQFLQDKHRRKPPAGPKPVTDWLAGIRARHAPNAPQTDRDKLELLHGLQPGSSCPHCRARVGDTYRSSCHACGEPYLERCCGYLAGFPDLKRNPCPNRVLVQPEAHQCLTCRRLQAEPERAERVRRLLPAAELRCAEDWDKTRVGRNAGVRAGKRWLRRVGDGDREGSCLVLVGPTRVGKSVLAARIARGALLQGTCSDAMWTTESALVEAARNPQKDESWQLIRRATAVELLIIDELWHYATEPYIRPDGAPMNSRRQVSELLHARWGRGAATIVTSNYLDMEGLLTQAFDDPTLVARWNEVGVIVEVTGQVAETRRA